jgi:hypothetical protein
MTITFDVRNKEAFHIHLFSYKYVANPHEFHLTGADFGKREFCPQSPTLPGRTVLGEFADRAAFEHTTFLNNASTSPLSAEDSVCELISHPPRPKWEHFFSNVWSKPQVVVHVCNEICVAKVLIMQYEIASGST